MKNGANSHVFSRCDIHNIQSQFQFQINLNALNYHFDFFALYTLNR